MVGVGKIGGPPGQTIVDRRCFEAARLSGKKPPEFPETTFFKLMEERYSKKSTLISTNLDYEEWYSFLGQKQMVGALLDRLRHHCHTIRMEGASLRTPSG